MPRSCSVGHLEHERVRNALKRLVLTLEAIDRKYPVGALHAREVWCDCAYCEARSVLGDPEFDVPSVKS